MRGLHERSPRSRSSILHFVDGILHLNARRAEKCEPRSHNVIEVTGDHDRVAAKAGTQCRPQHHASALTSAVAAEGTRGSSQGPRRPRQHRPNGPDAPWPCPALSVGPTRRRTLRRDRRADGRKGVPPKGSRFRKRNAKPVESDECGRPARTGSEPGQARRKHQLSIRASRHLMAAGDRPQTVCVALAGYPSRVRMAPAVRTTKSRNPRRHRNQTPLKLEVSLS